MSNENIPFLKRVTSRKFLTTTFGMLGTFILASNSLMTPDVAIVVAAAIASYNWANSRKGKSDV